MNKNKDQIALYADDDQIALYADDGRPLMYLTNTTKLYVDVDVLVEQEGFKKQLDAIAELMENEK